MLGTIKFIFNTMKDQIRKGCEDWVEAVLYTKSMDLGEVSGGYSDDRRIRVIGPIVTVY